MINTIFHFVNDPTFDYQTAVNNGDISEYTIVFNSADHSIYCKGAMFGRMSRADMAETLGNISDLIPVATDSTLGGIKIGYTNSSDQNSRRYGVVLDDNNKAYVEVPWTDTITPVFDDSQLRETVNTERERIDALIQNIGNIVDQKNRQLYADSQWVNDVFGNGEEPGTIAWAYRNQIDGLLNAYNVWEYIDPDHPELGRRARISEIQQDINGITTRVGSAESSIDGLTTTTSTFTQRADAIETRVGAVETKADGIDTALSSFEQTVNTEISGIKTAHTNLSSSVASYESTNDGNIGNLIKMAAAVLDLKASSDAEGNLSTTTDLANVITNGSFTGYSGLSQRVSQTESGVSANASLIADVQDTIEGLDIDGAVTRATAGFASETWVGQNYDTKGSAATAEANAKGYADNIVAGAKAEVIASIDDTVAGMTVLVTKDSNGVIDSGITLKADQVTIDANQTNFKNAVGAFIKTDVLETGTATIDAATINSATITGTLSGVDGTFSGTLSGASGSFTGDVYANAFRAGSTQGFNITVESDSINFNYGDTPRAWFSMKKYVESTNGPVEDTSATNAGGFYLYLISPATGNLVTIDFTNLTFKEITSSGRPTPRRKNLIKLTNGTRTGEVKAETYTVYYTDDDGNGNAAPIAYYSDPALTVPLTNAKLVDVYMVDDPKDYYNYNYNIAILLYDGNYQAKDHVIRYRGVSMNGTDITTSGGYVYTATYGSGSNAYSRYCTPNTTAGNFTDADLANGGGAYKFSGGSSNGTYYIQYASSKTTSTGAMSFFKVNTSGTAMERLQVSAVS